MEGLEDFVSLADREFMRLKTLADGAISQLSEAQYFEKAGLGDNSVAVICKHVSGNLVSRFTDFLTTDGEKPDRNRDEEFIIRESDDFAGLKKKWDASWDVLFETLSGLKTEDLNKEVKIRGEGLTVLQAISRQLTHYAYHVGQIVFLSKHLCGENWTSLSIPVGQSQSFNEAPSKYIGGS